MREVNIDLLIGSGISNKETEKANMQLYRKLMADFSALKSFWGKAFFIYMLERAEDNELKYCGKKLHLEMRSRESAVYDRYIKHFLHELKKDMLKKHYDTIMDNITDAMISQGQEEFIILNRVIFNCTDKFKFKKISLTKDMRELIEKPYN